MIISFHENRHDDGYIHGDDDYFGYENLRDVCFLNNRCFLYISGMLTYSYSRIAELDLENYTVTYLTDYFDDKTNAFTTFNSYYPFSFEYPNKYSVFVDGGSAGGTIVWDYENRVGIQMNNLSHEMRSINESARVSTTQQGFRRYTHYNEETGALSWIAIERAGERVVTVTIMGQPEDILREEETILDIINSIHIYDYVSQGE